LGFPPELRTPPTRSRRRTSRWGQAIEHGPETTLTTSAEPPILRVHSCACDLASHDETEECGEGHPLQLLFARRPLPHPSGRELGGAETPAAGETRERADRGVCSRAEATVARVALLTAVASRVSSWCRPMLAGAARGRRGRSGCVPRTWRGRAPGRLGGGLELGFRRAARRRRRR
jgi:hypothetical protein